MNAGIKSIEELRSSLIGRPCAVIGAGWSAKENIKYLPENAYIIGINEHLITYPITDRVDMIATRAHRISKSMFNGNYCNLQERGIKLVSTWRRFSHYDTKDIIYDENRGWSGTYGASIALYMGADPVILLGMDLYQNDYRYYYSTEKTPRENPQWDDTPNLIEPWVSFKKNCPGSDMVRVLGCHDLIRDMFGGYNG